MVEDNRSCRRRAFLKSAGAVTTTVAGLSSAGLTAARRRRQPQSGTSSDEYRSLLRKRAEEGWSVDRWRAEIADRGHDFKYLDSRVTVDTHSDGSVSASSSKIEPVHKRDNSTVSAQRLNESSAILKLTYTDGWPNRLNFTWSLKDPWVSGPVGPHDFATMSIDSGDYNWIGPDIEFGPWASPSEAVQASSHSFRNAKYNAAKHSNRTVGRFSSWMDKGLDPIGGSPSTRKVYAEYVCRWTKTEITGMSVSTSGDASISFGTSTGIWRAETNTAEWKMDDGQTYTDNNPL